MKPTANRRAAQAVCLTVWLGLAVLVWIWGVPNQLERGCWLGEWPFEDGCSKWPTGNFANKPPNLFQQHLMHNVGDGRAWASLTYSLWVRKDPQAIAVLPWAKQFAPYNPQLLAVQVETSLQAKDWPTAASTLVTMVERGYSSAVGPLTALMTSPETQSAVLAQLTSESRWLDGVLTALDSKVPPSAIQRFVSEGSQLGVLRQNTILNIVERLKLAGEWIDAYTLWVAMNGKITEGLFNPGFDRRSMRRGFDWEWLDQSVGQQSLRVTQTSAAPLDGYMMELEMLDRAALPQPMLSQTVVLLGTQYHLSGRYMSDRLRSTDGLVWTMRCAGGGERWAQSSALIDTQRKWSSFEVDLTVPLQCGGAVKLQLEAASPGEARAGMAGKIYFDDFSLKPITTRSKP